MVFLVVVVTAMPRDDGLRKTSTSLSGGDGMIRTCTCMLYREERKMLRDILIKLLIVKLFNVHARAHTHTLIYPHARAHTHTHAHMHMHTHTCT